MTENWYPISAMKRPRTLVLVQWAAREFSALLWTNPQTGSLQWATYRDHELVFLPTKRDLRDWGTQPDAWQPIDGKWPDPLPNPLRSIAPRMVYEKVNFGLVDDASSADLAREMEADRSDANRSRSRKDNDGPDRWWRDVWNITYEPPGQVTRDMMEGRLLRAVSLDGVSRELISQKRQRVTSNALPELSDAAALAIRGAALQQQDPTRSYGIRLHRQPQDFSDYDTAMGWFNLLNPKHTSPQHLWTISRNVTNLNSMQKVVAFRSADVPWSFDDIGERILFRTKQRAEQIYKEALARAHKVANETGRFNVEMEKLKQRNRDHRRRSA